MAATRIFLPFAQQRPSRPSRLLRLFSALALLAALLLCAAPPAEALVYNNVTAVPNVQLEDAGQYVSDPDNLVSPADRAEMNRLLAWLRAETGIEAAVVALKNIGENDIRAFATALFQHWWLGSKEKDNGLLILLVTDPPQRSVVFETGYGLEGILPDALCYEIQQRNMVPYLRENNYSQGLRRGVESTVSHLLGQATPAERSTPPAYAREAARNANKYPDQSSRPNQHTRPGEWMEFLPLLMFAAMFVFVLWRSYTRRWRICPRCKQRKLRLMGRRVLAVPTYSSRGRGRESLKCTNCGHEETREITLPQLRNRSSGGGGGGGGGGFSGRSGGGGGGRSGGGFGGGRSGGGGARSGF